MLVGSYTFIDSYSLTPNILKIHIRFFDIKIGEGEDILAFDIPEATFYFKDVTFCERAVYTVGEDAKWELLGTELEDLPEKPGDSNPEFTISGESSQPVGRVRWGVRAATFEMELEDGLYEMLVKGGFLCRLAG